MRLLPHPRVSEHWKHFMPCRLLRILQWNLCEHILKCSIGIHLHCVCDSIQSHPLANEWFSWCQKVFRFCISTRTQRLRLYFLYKNNNSTTNMKLWWAKSCLHRSSIQLLICGLWMRNICIGWRSPSARVLNVDVGCRRHNIRQLSPVCVNIGCY